MRRLLGPPRRPRTVWFAAMKAPSTLLVPALLLAAATVLAACGSRDTSSGSGSSPSALATPSTQPSTPSGGGAVTASTPCTGASFGAALQPKDAPSDVHKYTAVPSMQIDAGKLYMATITTVRGDIAVCLQPRLAPKTVNNFVVLARNHFYDRLTFHRIVDGFVIQGGDPLGTGSGGPGYQFADEPVQGDYTIGCMAMANAGPNTNGSQFFVCTADDTRLPKSYSLFGQVSKGIEVALQIQKGDVMQSVTVQEQS
jgi:cyclophilin family peptidyl-prolyl cis-trans isomerase/predicted small secreted protein